MAKTAAQRQQARRARLKLNKKKLLEYRNRDVKRKRESRLSMNAAQFKAFRKRGKIATRKWRLKLPTSLRAAPKTSHYSDIYPYRTPASFGKARRRVEYASPKSPRKRTVVLANLADGLQVKSVTKVHAHNKLNPAVKTAVIDFLNNDSVSRMMPGKADFLTVWQEDGSKER